MKAQLTYQFSKILKLKSVSLLDFGNFINTTPKISATFMLPPTLHPRLLIRIGSLLFPSLLEQGSFPFTGFLLWMLHFNLKAQCFSGLYFPSLCYALEERVCSFSVPFSETVTWSE
jgi:hypothetical protein